MIICIGPVCVPLWPIFFLLMRPLWNLLPPAWQERLTVFWDTKIYPTFVAPVLAYIPEKVQKFLFWGIKRRKDKADDGASGNPEPSKYGAATTGNTVCDQELKTVERDEDGGLLAATTATSAKAAEPLDHAPGSVVVIQNEDHYRKVCARSSQYRAVYLDFTATWCKPCQAIKPVFSALAEEERDALFCIVDADEVEEVAEEFGVTSLPTIVKLDRTGNEADRLKLCSEEKLKAFVA